MNPIKNYKILHLEPNENVVLEVRQHWIVFVINGIILGFMALLPLIVFSLVEIFAPEILKITPPGNVFWFFSYLYSLWLLVLWISFFSQWTKYYLDVWFVTEKRIIIVNQKRLFHREIFNVRFDRIQDVSIEVNGLISTFVGFGNVRVQTASEDNTEFFLNTVRRPEEVRKVIFSQHNLIADKFHHVNSSQSNTHPTHTQP